MQRAYRVARDHLFTGVLALDQVGDASTVRLASAATSVSTACGDSAAAVAEAAARVAAQTAVAKPEEEAMLDAKLDVMLATEAAIKLDDAPRMASLDQDN